MSNNFDRLFKKNITNDKNNLIVKNIEVQKSFGKIPILIFYILFIFH